MAVTGLAQLQDTYIFQVSNYLEINLRLTRCPSNTA